MRIVLTGGVTGGHIYPALAIGDKFLEHDPNSEIVFIGSGFGLESKIVPDHGFRFETVRAQSFDRKNALKIAGTVISNEAGKHQAYNIIKKFDPDMVISTGSFVSVPAVTAGHKYGCKIFIHEQNAFPGLANRSMSRYADGVFLGFSSAENYFREKSKVFYSGNPIRTEFYNRDRAAARAELGIPQDRLLIVIFGGSLGAEALNSIGTRIISAYGGNDKIHILFGTGSRYYDEVSWDHEQRGFDKFENVQVRPYLEKMPEVLAASDLVISRSGALTVSEITASGRAAIFVPSPNVTGDHQYYNAREVADRGGAVIVHEEAGAPDKVMNILREMFMDINIIREMEKANMTHALPDSAESIYETIMGIMG